MFKFKARRRSAPGCGVLLRHPHPSGPVGRHLRRRQEQADPGEWGFGGRAARTPRRLGERGGAALSGAPSLAARGRRVRNRKEGRTPTGATLHRKTEERAREGAAKTRRRAAPGVDPPARGRRLLVRAPQPGRPRSALPAHPPRRRPHSQHDPRDVQPHRDAPVFEGGGDETAERERRHAQRKGEQQQVRPRQHRVHLGRRPENAPRHRHSRDPVPAADRLPDDPRCLCRVPGTRAPPPAPPPFPVPDAIERARPRCPDTPTSGRGAAEPRAWAARRASPALPANQRRGGRSFAEEEVRPLGVTSPGPARVCLPASFSASSSACVELWLPECLRNSALHLKSAAGQDRLVRVLTGRVWKQHFTALSCPLCVKPDQLGTSTREGVGHKMYRITERMTSLGSQDQRRWSLWNCYATQRIV